jgi:hypothetical protein
VVQLPECYGFDVYHVIGATKNMCRLGGEAHADLVPKTGASCATLKAAGADTVHSYGGNPAGLPGEQDGQVCVGLL